jgi:predicted peroxiredoxin
MIQEKNETANCSVVARSTSNLYVVFLASGFNNISRARSAFMFASLAAAANYRTVLYCIQDGVDLMVKGAIEKNETPQPGVPNLNQRVEEAIDVGVEIQCCTQTMANKKIREEDLLPNVRAAGAMSLIELTVEAKGSINL